MFSHFGNPKLGKMMEDYTFITKKSGKDMKRYEKMGHVKYDRFMTDLHSSQQWWENMVMLMREQ